MLHSDGIHCPSLSRPRGSRIVGGVLGGCGRERFGGDFGELFRSLSDDEAGFNGTSSARGRASTEEKI